MKWIEASQLPEDEKVYLKKDFLGWRVIEPWKREDGSVNWFNLLLGGKRNLVTLIIILLIVLSLFFAVKYELPSDYQNVVKHPCDYCSTCIQRSASFPNINVSIIKAGDINETG